MQLQTGYYELSIADIIALNTTPKTVQPDVVGFTYLTDWTMFIRDGQPFLTFPGNLQLRVRNEAALVHSAVSAGIIGTGAGNRAAGFALGMTTAGGAGDAAGSFGSKGLELLVLTSNPTVNAASPGGPITVIHKYYLVPTYIETARLYWRGGPTPQRLT